MRGGLPASGDQSKKTKADARKNIRAPNVIASFSLLIDATHLLD